MARTPLASTQLCVALGSLLFVGCGDAGMLAPDVDGGIVIPDGGLRGDAGRPIVDYDAGRFVDAFVPRTDSGGPTFCTGDIECDDGDPSTRDACVGGACQNTPSACTRDWDCSDFDACTTDACVSGACAFTPIPMCAGCHSDAGCDDANPSTTDVCDTFTRQCQHFPNNPFCTTPADCNDGNVCTSDQCNSGTCAWGSIGTCCFRDTDCDDFDRCTTDACTLADHSCTHTSIPGCGMSSCMDFDHDGYGSRNCFPTPGTDCDDFNAAVTVTIHLDDLPTTTTMTCPGCPPPPPQMHQIWHNVIVERTCGDAASAIGALTSGSGCYTWSPSGGGFSGSRDHTISLRRVPTGMYTIEVQARDMFGWMPTAIPFDLTVSATPSASAACTGSVLVEGSTVHGTTTGAADAFGLDCSGTAFTSPEVVHSFDLVAPRRVRLIGTPRVAPMSYAPGMQLALHGACNPDVAASVCVDSRGYTCAPSISIERILPAGPQLVEIQSLTGGVDYDLQFLTEAVGEACAGAPVIRASGSFSGTNVGGVDHFRWNNSCGGGAAAEVIYELDVAVSSRVVLDLVSSAHTPVLRILSGCGDHTVAGSADSAHIDTTLAAGTYQVVVDGATATDVGSFVLNATLLAM